MRYSLPLFLALLALPVGSAVRADQPEPLDKLNVLVVLDTGDGVIGDTLSVDKKRILSLLQRQLPRTKLAIKTLEGAEANRANISAYYKGLKIDGKQGVLFYYGGHGGATKAGQHFFVLSPDKYERFYRDDVQKLMEGTGAGLVVMLTDCCSDIPPTKARSSAGLDKVQDVPKTNPKGECKTVLYDLLFRGRGTVNITAAAVGEKAYCDTENGGVFTRALCATLERDRTEFPKDSDDTVSWNEVYPLVESRTKELFIELKKANAGDIKERESQTPKPFSLGVLKGKGSTFAVISLENLTSTDLNFEYRWEGETTWEKASLPPEGRQHFFKPVTTKERGTPNFEARFAKIRDPKTGEPRIQPMMAKLWTGSGKPAFANGELFILSIRKPQTTAGPSPRAPEVTLRTTMIEVKDEELKLTVEIHPGKAGVKPVRASLWVEDYKLPIDLPLDAKGVLVKEGVRIPADALRIGTNKIRLVAETEGGDQGSAAVTIDRLGGLEKPTLYALCIGANGYKGVKGLTYDDLRCPEGDASALANLLEKQGGKFYGKVEVRKLTGSQVKVASILDNIKEVARKAKPQDRFVLFMSGQSYRPADKTGKPVAGAWSFVCPDTNIDKPATFLPARVLGNALAGLPCQKLVLIDANAAEVVASSLPLGSGMLFVGACKANQYSNEPADEKFGKHSLFTGAILEGLTTGKATTFDELVRHLNKRVPERLRQLVSEDKQEPFVFPSTPPRTQIFSATP